MCFIDKKNDDSFVQICNSKYGSEYCELKN